MDAIQFILKDHREIERLLKELERKNGAEVSDRVEGVLRRLVRALSTHAVIEEQYLYPAMREAGADTRVLDALEEHHAAKLVLAELEEMPASHSRFRSKLRVLAENVRRHIAQEESELLPVLERSLGDELRRDLGVVLERAKRAAPTRPHPEAPDTPPGVFVAGAVAAVYDRSRDALRDGTEVLRTLGVQGATRTFEGAKKLAHRAGRRGREAARAAAEHGRQAASKGREAVEQARESTARVELRGAEAASSVSRAARGAASRTRVRSRPARRRRNGGRARSSR